MNDNPTFDPRIQTEDIAFKPEEMRACPTCQRLSSPNGISCLYCGADLGEPADGTLPVKINLRKLENWERGFNVIFHEKTSDRPDIEGAAAILSSDASNIAEVVAAGTPLPLARVESAAGATMLTDRLSQLGLNCSIISDADLADDKLPRRLRKIEVKDGVIELTNFNTGKITAVAATDLKLIITGLIATSKVDSLEKKRRRGTTKLIEGMTTSADEAVLDLYTADDAVGYRVLLSGFDFSPLGEKKSVVAVANMRLLIGFLTEHTGNAKFVDDYTSVRHILGQVWDVETRNDPKGLRRAGFGRQEFASVGSTSNLRQFTKYSRLQWHLL
jgi:hypothetical protein